MLCKKNNHSGHYNPGKSKSVMHVSGDFYLPNSEKMGNLSLQSMHLDMSLEAKYPLLGGAQWSGEQECRRVGSSESVVPKTDED